MFECHRTIYISERFLQPSICNQPMIATLTQIFRILQDKFNVYSNYSIREPDVQNRQGRIILGE